MEIIIHKNNGQLLTSVTKNVSDQQNISENNVAISVIVEASKEYLQIYA